MNKKELQIDENKIEKIISKGTLSSKDDIEFKYIVEILKLFNINVKMWMKGSYILNNNEGIMFTKASATDWADEIDDNYFYEIYKTSNTHIEKENKYWGNKKIYIFRKNKNNYKFLGVFQQDMKRLDELFANKIYNKRPYKKIDDILKLK